MGTVVLKTDGRESFDCVDGIRLSEGIQIQVSCPNGGTVKGWVKIRRISCKAPHGRDIIIESAFVESLENGNRHVIYLRGIECSI